MKAQAHRWMVVAAIISAGATVSGLATETNDLVVKDSNSKVVGDLAEAKVDPAVCDNLVGRYDFGKLHRLRVTRDGNHLFAQFAGRNTAFQAICFLVAGLLVLICVALLSVEATFPLRGAIQRVAEVIQFTGVFFICFSLSNR